MTGLSAREHQAVRRQSMTLRNLGARWRRRRERGEREALAARLRRELVGFEEALSTAAGILEAARQEERDAGLALAGREVGAVALDALSATPTLEAARRRLELATKGRELAWLRFEIARSRVNFHAGALHQLEKELADDPNGSSITPLDDR